MLEVEAYQLHPVLLDACLQVLDATLLDYHLENTFIPVSLECLQVFGSACTVLWCYAQLHTNPRENPSRLKADLALYTSEGEPVACLKGIQLQSTRRESMINNNSIPWQDWLYELVWQPQPLETHKVKSVSLDNDHSNGNDNWSIPNRLKISQGISSRERKPRQWLIFVDTSGVGEKLRQHLQQQGDLCLCVFKGQQYQQKDVQTYTLNPEIPEHFERLFRESGPLQGVIHCWSLSSSDLLTKEDEVISTLDLSLIHI